MPKQVDDTFIRYRNVCLSKNIPLVMERGPNKGEIKTKKQLQRCLYQKARRVDSDSPFGTMPTKLPSGKSR